jgi:hypothetical protein
MIDGKDAKTKSFGPTGVTRIQGEVLLFTYNVAITAQ